MFLRSFLRLDEVVVRSLPVQQLVMSTLLNDAALRHNDDVVGVFDDTIAMTNYDCCSAFRRFIERSLYNVLALRIERRSRFDE